MSGIIGVGAHLGDIEHVLRLLRAMLNALSEPAAFRVVLPSFLLAAMVAMLGLIPMGLGAFEATCTTALVLLRGPIEAALTATLSLHGWTTWLPMFPGLLLVRREGRIAVALALISARMGH